MNYEFPRIISATQARIAIAGRDEFTETIKDGYTVFNYHVILPDSFDCPIRRELRGMIFDTKSGFVLSRRFHKFFNLNEREETQIGNIDWSKPHTIERKLDGSMISPILTSHGIRWTTKMGITDTSMKCEQYIAGLKQYRLLAESLCDQGYTPIFEYTSPTSRIVIRYPEDKLTLLAIRENIDGKYVDLDAVAEIAEEYNIPCNLRRSAGADIKETVDIVRSLENDEGIVIVFEDGHRVKVKSDWYVSLHNAKDQLRFEKNAIKLILDQKLDDILPVLDAEDRKRLTEYQSKLLDGIRHTSHMIEHDLIHYKKICGSKKAFALNIAPNIDSIDRPFYFNCWDNPQNVQPMMIERILKACTSQTNVDSIRKWTGVSYV
jgi:RNA ligase